MSTPSNTVPEAPLDAKAIAPAAMSETRPFYWSVRRELWENRSIYIAPLAVAGVILVGFLISLMWLPHSMRNMSAHHPPGSVGDLVMPYGHVTWLIILTGFAVGFFYSLDALHGERRDRSILFWKSLPVSDLTTVLSKASIPLVILPLFLFLLIVALHLIMLVLSSVFVLLSGGSLATRWGQLPFFQIEVGVLYVLIVMALWHAPLYAWLLLVSGWARRATFLWVVLPPAAVCIFEWIAFRTKHFGLLLGDRLYGFVGAAFALKMPDGTLVDPHFIPLAQFTPGRFLGSPGLWMGLIFAAAFLAAAVRMRRCREPI